MEKLLRYIFIASIVVIIVIAGIKVYDECFLPKMYITSKNYDESTDEKVNDMLQNIVIKYISNVKMNIKNIDYYIPAINRNNDKNKAFFNTLQDLYSIKCFKYYKINDSTYKVDYTVFEKQDKYYSVIIKIYSNDNYFKVLYDELYDMGKVE